MNVIVKPVPVGDMAGALAYFVTGSGDLTREQVVETITNNTLRQPRLVVIEDRQIAISTIEWLGQQLHTTHSLALVTTINAVTPAWNAVHRVVLISTVYEYTGLPANEIHLTWTPEDADTLPIVAPLSAANVHVYCTTQKGHFAELTEWARKAPYAIGVISRTL